MQFNFVPTVSGNEAGCNYVCQTRSLVSDLLDRQQKNENTCNTLPMYGINYAGTQVTQWDFQNKGTKELVPFQPAIPLF